MSIWGRIHRIFLNPQREVLRVLANSPRPLSPVSIVVLGEGRVTSDETYVALYALLEKRLVEQFPAFKGDGTPVYHWRITDSGRRSIE